MSLSPDDDLKAAEFALGTLDGGERATLAARRLREPDLDAAIEAWEQRLAPLSEAAPPLVAAARFSWRHRGAHRGGRREPRRIRRGRRSDAAPAPLAF